MPVYEYKCRDCGEIIEVFQKTFAAREVSCERCHSTNTEKIFSPPAAVRVSTAETSTKGTTCCGRSERCDTPPCSVGEGCRRDRQ
jgi:putative FmdB family regulatory protein